MKLFFTDLDDTIVRSDGTIAKETIHAFHELEKKGNKVVICTGRPIMALNTVLASLNLAKETPIICFNGAAIYNGNVEKIADYGFTPEDFKEVINACDELKLDYAIYDQNDIFVTNPDEKYTQVELAICSKPPKLLEQFKGNTSPKILCFVDPNKAQDIIDKLNYKTLNRFNISTSKPFFIEITPQGVNKGIAIKKLCELENIPLSKTTCFGDGDNDIAMFMICNQKVAVNNCSDKIRELATVITDSCDQNGIAKYIEKYEINN